MTNVLGMPVSCAEKQLQSEGYLVQLTEICCRKGVVGEDQRVVRQTQPEAGTVLLAYSGFITETKA